MSREVKRVPLNFDWPLKEVWFGYLTPDQFDENPCPDCERGYAPRAQYLHDLWYGRVHFSPQDNGSEPLTASTPEVRAFAERNVATASWYYGAGEIAIRAEAQRLATLWNGMWMHHLNDEDVAALIAADRLRDFTHSFDRDRDPRWLPYDPPRIPSAREVNRWSLQGMGHDSINCGQVVSARCEREGVQATCPTCEGWASLEKYPGQRAEAEAWHEKDHGPPKGRGWQLWETTTEGSPVSPVFRTAEKLARWLTTDEGGYAIGFGYEKAELTLDGARRFVKAGWAPSMIGDSSGVRTGVEYVAEDSHG